MLFIARPVLHAEDQFDFVQREAKLFKGFVFTYRCRCYYGIARVVETYELAVDPGKTLGRFNVEIVLPGIVLARSFARGSIGLEVEIALVAISYYFPVFPASGAVGVVEEEEAPDCLLEFSFSLGKKFARLSENAFTASWISGQASKILR